jgi:hypothetical protein
LKHHLLVTLVLVASTLLVDAGCSGYRNTEARKHPAGVHVKEIAEKAAAYYAEHKRFPQPGSATPAEGSCCEQLNYQCQPDAALWKSSPWSDIGFKIDEPSEDWVTLEITSSGFTARANSDMDCDRHYSTFEIIGKLKIKGEEITDAFDDAGEEIKHSIEECQQLAAAKTATCELKLSPLSRQNELE